MFILQQIFSIELATTKSLFRKKEKSINDNESLKQEVNEETNEIEKSKYERMEIIAFFLPLVVTALGILLMYILEKIFN
jgi:hypothetical protein